METPIEFKGIPAWARPTPVPWRRMAKGELSKPRIHKDAMRAKRARK